MRQGNGLRYALLGVVSQHPDGVHGYALKRQCERVLGKFWQVNFGEVYRILDRLAGEGLIEQITADDESIRKLYRITSKGKKNLDDFLIEPPNDAPRPMRQELAVKLLFAGPKRVDELLRLIDHQRDVYMHQLALLGSQRRRLARAGVESFVTMLLIDGAELSVRAELTWLDDVTAKVKERYGPAR
jgi:DNA-binding PadR family transcriptional regulator